MKKLMTIFCLLCLVVGLASSCKTGEGCPGENNWQETLKGSDKKSKPKSGLFKKKKK